MPESLRLDNTIDSPSRPAPGSNIKARGTREGALFTADYLRSLAMEGRIFFACDADANDLVTGQTSFADTTPTFLLRAPTNTVCLPLFMSLTQSGTVAGDTVFVLLEIDNEDSYASGGTSETILSSRTDQPVSPLCTLYSGATATTAKYGVRIDAWQLGQDIAPAEGAPNKVVWTPPVPIYLKGAASLKVYTYAGTTGPSWAWSFAWAELPYTGTFA